MGVNHKTGEKETDMRFFKHILAGAVVILAFGTWAFTQEGYYGQTAQEPGVAQQVRPATPVAPLILEQQRPAEIKLTTSVTVGNLRLEPGEYLFRFYTKGTEHFIRFAKVETIVEVHPEFSVNTYSYNVGDVKCDMVPLPSKAPQTLISELSQHGMDRIVKIEFRGDSVAHVL